MKHEFEQIPKESNKAYQAFLAYCDQGPGRSIQETATKIGKSTRLLKGWSSKYDWMGRVTAHDAHLARVEQESEDEVYRKKAARWVRLQEELREKEYAVVDLAIENCKRAMSEKVDEGEGVDLMRVFEMASNAGRLAAGLPAEHVKVTEATKDGLDAEFVTALNKAYGAPRHSSREGCLSGGK